MTKEMTLSIFGLLHNKIEWSWNMEQYQDLLKPLSHIASGGYGSVFGLSDQLIVKVMFDEDFHEYWNMKELARSRGINSGERYPESEAFMHDVKREVHYQNLAAGILIRGLPSSRGPRGHSLSTPITAQARTATAGRVDHGARGWQDAQGCHGR